MNRPMIQNYEFVHGDKYSTKFDWDMYRKDLEKYCDELEKALDKACWCITHNIDFLTEVDKTEDEWKRWFLGDWY